jgi:uncharacterized protein YqfB (UPF0267 family)
MAYSNITAMTSLLPKTVTISQVNVTTPVLTSPGTQASIDILTAQSYINYATQEINSRLSTVYVVPLKRFKSFETFLTADAQKGTITISVHDNGPFQAGDLIRIGDLTSSELNEITTITDIDTVASISSLTLRNKLSKNYTMSNQSIVSIISYPDPVPITCARIAVAAIIDKLFVAQQEPDVSNYGKSQRTLASSALDEIMVGTIRLNGQDFVGKRFVRMPLRDTMSTAAEVQRGTGKEV